METNDLLELLPIYGTYKEGERFFENPSWGGAASLGLSAIGDVGTVFGVGLGVKALSAMNKARRAYKAANVISKTATTLLDVSKAGKTAQRFSNGVNSLTLLGSPTNIITNRIKNAEKAVNTYNKTLNAHNAELKAIVKFSNIANEAIEPQYLKLASIGIPAFVGSKASVIATHKLQ